MSDLKVTKISDEQNDEISNDDLFNITSWGADLSFREIVSMYEDGELLKPDLQRKYVWKPDEASKFIDSILLGLPVPSIFLAKTSDETKLIVDGYQRIMTVHDFIKGVFSDTKMIFKLSNTKGINEKWRNKTFAELSLEEQRRIKTTTIHAIVFEQKKPLNDSGMYQVFERINTSGRALNAQEIRNCVYYGKFNNLLMDLNKLPVWRNLLSSPSEDSRMIDVEYILRFFAMDNLADRDEKKKNQISLKKYLNTYMGDGNKLSDLEIESLHMHFEKVMSYIFRELGSHAFGNIKIKDKKPDGFIEKFHPTIFDAISVSTSYVIKNNLIDITTYKICKENHISLLLDEQFIDSIKNRTTNTNNIYIRINKACQFLYGVSYEW